MDLSLREWLAILCGEYLEDFIPAGGAAVKFVVPHAPIRADELRTGLRQAAEDNGFQFAFVDSASTRLHLVDRLFHEVARQIDWEALAYAYLIALLQRQSYALPTTRNQFSLSTLAELNGRDEPSLRQDILRDIETGLLRDYEMGHEFRRAMVGLCKSQLDTGYDPVESAIKDWLLGAPVRISSLKNALIFQKIGRHNARHMLFSLAHWLRLSGGKGLVLGLDITRYAQSVPPAQRDGANYYSTAAALDAYEVLRQFIDGTDELASCLIVVIAGSEFLTDDVRGASRYHALNLRIADEVRDRDRQNPLASLVRLRETPTHNDEGPA